MGRDGSRIFRRASGDDATISRRVGVPCWVLALALSISALGAEDPGERDFFESKVRPVLAERCYPCHSSAASKSKGGLRLDDRAAARAGGDSGPAVVPGRPDDSLLILAVERGGSSRRCPPRRRCPPPRPPISGAGSSAGRSIPGTGPTRRPSRPPIGGRSRRSSGRRPPPSTLRAEPGLGIRSTRSSSTGSAAKGWATLPRPIAGP